MRDTSIYKYYKRRIKEFAKESMIANMLCDSIRHLIPKEWEIWVDGWNEIKIVKEDASLPDVHKLTKKLANWLGKEPRIEIEESGIDVRWLIYQYACVIEIRIRTKNVEKCEIITKKAWTTKTVLTGYCKAFTETKFVD